MLLLLVLMGSSMGCSYAAFATTTGNLGRAFPLTIVAHQSHVLGKRRVVNFHRPRSNNNVLLCLGAMSDSSNRHVDEKTDLDTPQHNHDNRVEDGQPPTKRKKYSVGRYGGRRRRRKKSKAGAVPVVSEKTAMPFSWKISAAAVALLLRLFASGSDTTSGSSSYYHYYYSYSSITVRDSNGIIRQQENSNFKTNMRQERLLLQSQQQRDLQRQEDEALDAFTDQTFRSIERMMDESWE